MSSNSAGGMKGAEGPLANLILLYKFSFSAPVYIMAHICLTSIAALLFMHLNGSLFPVVEPGRQCFQAAAALEM